MFENAVTHHYVLRKSINAELIYRMLLSEINPQYFICFYILVRDGNINFLIMLTKLFKPSHTLQIYFSGLALK